MDSRLNDQDIWASVRRLGLDKKIKHYSILQQILLVGEGDFSFSLALAKAFGSADNLVASSLNSRKKIISSYEAGQNNLGNLEKLGAMILHGVNATEMNKHEIIKEIRFDRIVFNFPHAGFFGNEKDNGVIKKHRKLLKMFFKNGMTMLNKNGEIHVTHQEQDPYDKWKVVEEAEKCGLLLKESVEFDKADYPGYTNRRGAGSRIGETFFLGECKTYMFILRCNDQIHSVLPKISLQGHLEILKAAILELETERQNRRAAETAKANLESSFNDLRTVADKALKETDEFRRIKDRALSKKAEMTKQKEKIAKELGEALRLEEEFRRQRDNAFHQKDQVWREKENIAKQIAEALRLKEDAAMQRDASFQKPGFERKDRIYAESARDEILKERDEFRSKKDEVLREKVNIAKQLAEALRLKEEAAIQRDVNALELESERKARIDAESQKANLEVLIHELRTVIDETFKERDEFRRIKDRALRKKAKITKQKEKIAKELDEALRLEEEFKRQRDNAFHQKDQVWREKENIAKQLAEALRLKEDAAIQRDVNALELESERKARIDAEFARDETLKKINEFRSKKDEVFREKVNIAKQLDEALRFKEDVVKERAEELQSSKKFLLVLVLLCIFIYFYYHPEKLVQTLN